MSMVARPRVRGSRTSQGMRAVLGSMLHNLTPNAKSPMQPKAVQQCVRRIQQLMNQMSSSNIYLMLRCHAMVMDCQRLARLKSST